MSTSAGYEFNEHTDQIVIVKMITAILNKSRGGGDGGGVGRPLDLFDPSQAAAGRSGDGGTTSVLHPELVGMMHVAPSSSTNSTTSTKKTGKQSRKKLQRGFAATAEVARLGPERHDAARLAPSRSFWGSLRGTVCNLHPVIQIFNSKDLWIPRGHLAILLFHKVAAAMVISAS